MQGRRPRAQRGDLACARVLAHPRASSRAATPVTRVPPDSSADPAWRSPDDPRLAGLHGLRHWLLDDGSLTRRLVDSGGAFRVQRLSQRWATPRASERRVLANGLRQRALVREVALRLDGEAVVFARSVFPYASLCGSLALFWWHPRDTTVWGELELSFEGEEDIHLRREEEALRLDSGGTGE